MIKLHDKLDTKSFKKQQDMINTFRINITQMKINPERTPRN